MSIAAADDSSLAPEPAADPLHIYGPIERVVRTLRYAAAEDGAHLWRLRWVERTCLPLLEDVLAAGGLTEETAFRVHAAAEQLRGLDARYFPERLAPIREALDQLSSIAMPPRHLLLESLVPRGGVVEVEDLPEAPPEPRGRGRKGGRSSRKAGRGKAGDGSKEGAPEAPSVDAAKRAAAAKPPRYPLGHAEHTGRSLGEVAAELSAPQPLLEALAARGVCTVADLLTLPPVDHEQLIPLDGEAPLPHSGQVAVRGELIARWTRLSPGGRAVELFVRSGMHTLACRWAGAAPPELAGLSAGDQVTLVGEIALDLDEDEEGASRAVLLEALPWRADSRGVVRRPIYGIEGADEEGLRQLIRRALATFSPGLKDTFPSRVLREGRLLGLSDALEALHIPAAGFDKSRERFVFEELFLHQLKAASAQPVRLRGISHKLNHELIGQLQLLHGIQLDDFQEAAFDEIRRDLRRPQAMTRLLQGDVGAGKSLVALLAAVMVAGDRSQVLFLAPDELAAEHRFLFAEPLLRSVGVVPQLLDPEPGAAQLDAIQRGNAQLIFATHNHASSGLPEFKKLGLVVVEERDSFRVISRDELAQGNLHPDLLVITSVPIPSSLVFTVFNDYTLSIIDMPSVQQVETRVGGQDTREEVYQRVRELLASGRQGYVVFPLIDGRDLIDLPKARLLARSLADEAFPGARVATYHGAMSREERIRVFEDFQHRRIDLLLATTTIEDAPDVANATAMVIEYADRYDLVRLHRLRGYVSKGSYPGYCAMLLTDKPQRKARELVELVAREQDGFAIAERDRLQRGDEALLGSRAGDVPGFRWAKPARDRELLLRARRIAFGLLGQDPQLRQQANREIADKIGHTPKAGQGGGRRRRSRRRRR